MIPDATSNDGSIRARDQAVWRGESLWALIDHSSVARSHGSGTMTMAPQAHQSRGMLTGWRARRWRPSQREQGGASVSARRSPPAPTPCGARR